jgi:hypothetical protein
MEMDIYMKYQKSASVGATVMDGYYYMCVVSHIIISNNNDPMIRESEG